MAALVSVITTDLKAIFPDATTARCERAINLANEDLVSRIPALSRVLTSQNLTSGTATYDLPAGCTEVRAVYYATSANAAVRLKPIHVQQLDRDKEDSNGVPWQYQAAGTPEFWYVANGISTGQQQSNLLIGLHPKPDTSTSGGFPVLSIAITEIRTLVDTDTIPEGLAAGSAYYRNRAAYHLALELRDADEAAYYMTLADEAMERCVAMFPLIPRDFDPRELLPTPRP